MLRVEIDAAQLDNVRQLEWQYNAKFVHAEVWPDGHTVIELQPVADVSWYIDVWDRQARLVLVRGDGSHVNAEDELELDAELLDAVVRQVIYEDHNSDRDVNRAYFPLSQESVNLFQRLMAKVRSRVA